MRSAMKLIAVIIAAGGMLMSCQKTMDAPSVETQGAINAPLVEKHSFPITDRDGNVLGYVQIDGEKGGLATVNLEFTQPWLFNFITSYEAGFYTGQYYIDSYIQLQNVTSDTATWKNFPVRDANNKLVRADELLQLKPRFKLIAPFEVMGMAQVN